MSRVTAFAAGLPYRAGNELAAGGVLQNMGTQHDSGRHVRGGVPQDRSGDRTRERSCGEGRDPDRAPAEDVKNDGKSPGRVVFDSRGNSVWRWENEHDESTSILLKRLENDDLALEPTRPVPILGKKTIDDRQPAAKADRKTDQKLSIQDKRKGGGGFDPYNRS